MTIFKSKLRQIGNSFGVIIPKEVITGINSGDEITLQVITDDKSTGENPTQVITFPIKKAFNTGWCTKHGSMKGTCGCE